MNDFLEEHLRQALRHQQPPDGFAERVLARVPPARPGVTRWYAGLAAAVVLALLFAGFRQQRQSQEKYAHETERQVVFALALAIEKVQHVNDRLQQSTPKVKIQERQKEL